MVLGVVTVRYNIVPIKSFKLQTPLSISPKRNKVGRWSGFKRQRLVLA